MTWSFRFGLLAQAHRTPRFVGHRPKRYTRVPFSKKAVSTPTTALSPISLLRALRRRQTLAIGLAILAVGFCGPAAWFLVPAAKYQAQAKLQVVASVPKVLFRTVESESSGGEDYKRYQSTQLALIKSEMVLNAANFKMRKLENSRRYENSSIRLHGFRRS